VLASTRRSATDASSKRQLKSIARTIFCALVLVRKVWAVDNDMTRFLTIKTLHRPSPTVRRGVYVAAVSYWTVFWHVSAQILARSCHRSDLLCPRPRHGSEHPCFARLAEHVNGKVSFFAV